MVNSRKSIISSRKKSLLSQPPKNLREVLKQNRDCEKKFLEAERLAKGLFDENKYTSIPYFTQHGINHCEKLEEFANRIIWRSVDFVDHEFQPTPEEAMYLLSGIWLHDIGMMYRIFEGENAKDLVDEIYAIKIRDEHEQRTAKYILKRWKLNCSWDEQEKVSLASICYFHRKRHPFAQFDPANEVSSYEYDNVRLAVLAALLRLVDGCHVDQSRAPLALFHLYNSVGMSASHALHWERANLITDLQFDHENREITIVANCPEPYEFFGGKFDLKQVVKLIQQEVFKELESVQSILLPWSNLFFLNVTIKTRIVKSMECLYKEQYFALWPYLLQDPRSSTELSATFVQITLFILDIEGMDWVIEVQEIITEIRKLRKLDFMLINLCAKVEAIISKSGLNIEQRKGDLRSYLVTYNKSIKDNCEKIIPHALGHISPGTTLFVFGYSINIEKILKKISTKIEVVVIDCYEPLENGFLYTENKKMLDVIVKDSGIEFDDIHFIQYFSFPHILSNLKANNKKAVLLLGVHGVLDDQNLLCKVGSELLVRCANDYGVEVVAFAEKSKFLNPEISLEERDTINNYIVAENKIDHPQLGVKCVEFKIDLVPCDLVNTLITEEGLPQHPKLQT